MGGFVACLRSGLTQYRPTRFARSRPGAPIFDPKIYKHWRT
jgi:hypothetical protein